MSPFITRQKKTNLKTANKDKFLIINSVYTAHSLSTKEKQRLRGVTIN